MTAVAHDAGHDVLSDHIPQSVRRLVRREMLDEQIDALIDAVSSDAFLGYVNEMGALPTHDERRTYTARTASVETLAERGLRIPDGLRFTTREFELPEDGLKSNSSIMRLDPDLDPRMGFCVSVGVVVCISFGG
nr:hypothetical protein [Micromonospora sp. DSM 115978]